MPAEAKLMLTCTYSSVVNYAMQQNHVPIIRELVVTNNMAHDLSNVAFRFSAAPEFAFPFEKRVAVLPPDQPVNVGLIDLQLSPAYLAALTERLSGTLLISAFCGDEVLHSETLSIDVLAFDEWGGYPFMPEMLAAFVTPNHPLISRLTAAASRVLKRWSGNSALDGYLSKDPSRVKLQVAAIYAAVQAENIIYCVPPASFERQGQRIRLCDTVLAQKLGTCLDLTLLYASCLEAIGLNPLIVILEGHAFVAAWLVDDCFPEAVQDDPSLLTKRLADGINQICVVETTACTEGKTIGYMEAQRLGVAHLSGDKEFVCLIDIKRTRAGGIRPLPMRVLTAEGWEVEAGERGQRALTEAPTGLHTALVPDEIVQAGTTPLTRQQQWERKLLDLSLRNTLLNFRVTAGTIRLLALNLGRLEDSLAQGSEFQILEKPTDWDNTARDARVFEIRNQLDPMQQLLEFEFQQKRLRTPLSEVELTRSVTNLYRSARTALEENGVSTLYLALGFLKWYEAPASQQVRYAPLVLVPVEIARKSAKRGYVVRSRDEETQMNITLLEMLRQDFELVIGGLDPLPTDEHGVDLRRILTIVRKAVMHMPRWDVSEEAFLGIFSFSQFIMWNDIRNRSEDLAKNKIVASLMSGKLEWLPEGITAAEADLDETYPPGHVFLPVSADASQLCAITAASEGKSFVLHGPPGTGKSQTITNIIANALAQGKTVLFVAEKMAALSVVQKRLEAIGLGPFCLEVHSNKTRKKDVLDQLGAAAETVKRRSPEEYREEGERLARLRTELNGYVQALHTRYPFDITLYDAIARFSHVSRAQDGVKFDQGVFATLSHRELNGWMDLAKELAVAGAETGHPHNHPLREICLTAYSQSVKASAQQLLEEYADVIRECAALAGEISRRLDFPDLLTSPLQVKALAEVSGLVPELAGVPVSMLKMDEVDGKVARIKDVLQHGERYRNLHQQISGIYRESVWDIDVQAMSAEWQKAGLRWFLPQAWERNHIKKALRQLALSKKGVSKEEIPAHLELISEAKKEREGMESRLPEVLPCLGVLWQDLQTDWQQVERKALAVAELERNLAIYTNRAEAGQIRCRFADVISEAGLDLKMFDQFQAASRRLFSLQGEVSRLLGIEMDAIRHEGVNWLGLLGQKTSSWLSGLEGLRAWCTWLNVRRKACEAGPGLTSLVEEYESGRLANDEVAAAFEKGLYRACAEFIISREPALNSFSGQLFEEKIRRFRETDTAFEELTRREIYARLAARIPDFLVEASKNSELGILRRAIKSNGRGLSLRMLFEQIPGLLPRLCPCLLMSPMSVAQYLDPKHTPFDLVVFDEASQMPTCEAVGALARGKNAVIVGDPKQLPPTSFFTSNRMVDEDILASGDLESILDDCLALAIPEAHLSWHYRSQHESLIAFSNRRYYENKLFTFPSPHDLVSKVSLRLVEGFYDRGKTKHNKAEAKAVVDEIVRRLTDPGVCGQSIGVVTFSSVQQNLIEDLLQDALSADPALEGHALAEEPIFIKNLENVQGDERDVILFSVGYGPDEKGRLSLNFGPLNRDGGWRRLNVAVSRARSEMVVYSTIRPEQLDISRTGAQGVADLKAFLEFAQKGKAALVVPADELEAGPSGSKAAALGISDLIASELREHGYTAKLDIGSSAYRLDLAVVHPEKPSEYLLGIVTDGRSYRSARTARDRELLQENVLRRLGWNIHKVWAVDWWESPEKEMKKILSVIEGLLEKGHPGDSDHRDELSPAKTKPFFSSGQNRGESDGRFEKQPARVAMEEEGAGHKTAGSVSTIPTAKVAAQMATRVNPYQRDYVIAVLPRHELSATEFCLPENAREIMQAIAEVIRVEAPISKSLLCKRVLQSFGIARTGARLERQFSHLFLKLKPSKTKKGQNTFFWRQEQAPQSLDFYRVAQNENARRSAEDLAPEETACAVRYVLMTEIGLPREELIRETARILGYHRLGRDVELAMKAGLEAAVKRGWAETEGDRVNIR
ncbi:Restriction endonuclease type II-like [Acididesulfobacillus acetoxydans]|uniref:DNA helicase-like protein n=1 Tax=Acididesulfobacillus acetoxydans TaxID=1561005 RepID=A0A8S0WR66_9FIRM|nr:DUF3320 domain-containing protein [Acididesulfobacillus acetoxydans]CAA7603104.1 Restriction endonuclease type II-like [Acididesulfobacillus acetoxydans]CEJ05658.1 DNA helicase-like protein [Acididesulfobacillus acetoxydans]